MSTVLGFEVQRRGLKVLFASLPSPPPRAIIYGGMCLYRLTRTIRSFDVLLLFIQNIFPFKPQPNFLCQAPVDQMSISSKVQRRATLTVNCSEKGHNSRKRCVQVSCFW